MSLIVRGFKCSDPLNWGFVFTVLGIAIIDVSAMTLDEPIPLIIGAVVLVMMIIRGIPIVKRIKTTPRFKESEAVEG
jgi:hypothetical protein